jgi:hypothetical protein
MVRKYYLKIGTDFILLFPEVILTDKRGNSERDYGCSVLMISERSYRLPAMLIYDVTRE